MESLLSPFAFFFFHLFLPFAREFFLQFICTRQNSEMSTRIWDLLCFVSVSFALVFGVSLLRVYLIFFPSGWSTQISTKVWLQEEGKLNDQWWQLVVVVSINFFWHIWVIIFRCYEVVVPHLKFARGSSIIIHQQFSTTICVKIYATIY